MLDAYERRARLQPALIAASPLGLAVVAAGLAQHPVVDVLAAGALEVGATFILADLARRRGRAIEPDLWASWGGPPTTMALRHDGPTARERLGLAHAGLCRLVDGVDLPSAQDENDDPAGAIGRYEAATEAARNLLRADPLGVIIAAENRNYGFHRNLLGLRLVGSLISSFCLVAASIIGVAAAITGHGDAARRAAAAAFGAAAILGFWRLYVTPERVRWAADRYADAFIGALAAVASRPAPPHPAS